MLGMIAADPHDAVAAHDRVYRIGLPRERRGVRAGDLGAGEVVEAALASRVTVDHPHRPRPTRPRPRRPPAPATPGAAGCSTSSAARPAVATAARTRAAFTRPPRAASTP